jgi:hypothetical protein
MNTGWEYAGASAHAAAGFGGMWINKLYAAFTFSPRFTTRLEGMYIFDTANHGDTIGTTRKANGLAKDNDDIGFEIDWFNTLTIYKNLTFQFGAGYLFAGDAMNQWDPIGGGNASMKNPWVITTNLTYSF